ncbi:hypothetical protein YC2023_016816 [Brassica napus]
MEIQMEVQKKLHEQIETQQQLQVRIEAQGKYLQSVLLKAQETLSGYNSFNLYAVASMANRNYYFMGTEVGGLTEDGGLTV